jgi:hypothetical protein
MSDIGTVAGRTVVAGAAGLAAGGPLGALVGVATQIVPEIVRSIAGDSAGQVATQAASIVQEVAGTTDPVVAAAAITGDPQKALEARIRLTELAIQAEAAREKAKLDWLQAMIADQQSARAMASQSRSMARAQIWIGSAILLLFAVVLSGVWYRGVPPGSEAILNILLGMLGGGVMSVVGFFFGGSVGSQDKTGILSQLTAAVMRQHITASTVPTLPTAAPSASPPASENNRSSIFSRS